MILSPDEQLQVVEWSRDAIPLREQAADLALIVLAVCAVVQTALMLWRRR